MKELTKSERIDYQREIRDFLKRGLEAFENRFGFWLLSEQKIAREKEWKLVIGVAKKDWKGTLPG
jgi:hypothetical protein